MRTANESAIEWLKRAHFYCIEMKIYWLFVFFCGQASSMMMTLEKWILKVFLNFPSTQHFFFYILHFTTFQRKIALMTLKLKLFGTLDNWIPWDSLVRNVFTFRDVSWLPARVHVSSCCLSISRESLRPWICILRGERNVDSSMFYVSAVARERQPEVEEVDVYAAILRKKKASHFLF